MAEKKNNEATPLTEEQLLQKENDLNSREEALNKREEALNSKENELTEKESNLNELEESLLNTEGNDVAPEPEPGLEFTFEKEKFKFDDLAPKNLRIGGKKLSQQEIVKDKDLLPKIIKSSYIKKIK